MNKAFLKILFLFFLCIITSDVFPNDRNIDSVDHNFKISLSLDKEIYEKGEEIYLTIKLINISRKMDSVANFYFQEALYDLKIKNINSGELIKFRPSIIASYAGNLIKLKKDSSISTKVRLFDGFGNEYLPEKNKLCYR